MKDRRRVKGEQVITLQIAQQLKTKNINVVPGKLFVVNVKLNICQRQTHCIYDQDKFQSFTDTDNEFTWHSIGISPVSLRASMKTLKSNISEAQKVQAGCLKDSESDS